MVCSVEGGSKSGTRELNSYKKMILGKILKDFQTLFQKSFSDILRKFRNSKSKPYILKFQHYY